MTSRPTYSEQQLELYLERIGYSTSGGRLQNLRQNIDQDALGTLGELQRRHIAAIPWGNSALHYSQHHTNSLNPKWMFEKMVSRRHDGYCMESTGMFLIVLRSLGYTVYPTAGRVSHAAVKGVDDGLYLAFNHMVLIVCIQGEKYMADVGFGNNCATSPLPLQEFATAAFIAPSEMRLVKESIAEFENPSQKVWIYQVRYNPDSAWLPQFCFSDIEFLPQDFEVMNFSVSQSRTSMFIKTVICTRMLLSLDGSEVKGQCVMAGREVKRRIRGQTEVLETLQSEGDRVAALAKYFDMHFHEDEIQGIQGMTSEII